MSTDNSMTNSMRLENNPKKESNKATTYTNDLRMRVLSKGKSPFQRPNFDLITPPPFQQSQVTYSLKELNEEKNEHLNEKIGDSFLTSSERKEPPSYDSPMIQSFEKIPYNAEYSFLKNDKSVSPVKTVLPALVRSKNKKLTPQLDIYMRKSNTNAPLISWKSLKERKNTIKKNEKGIKLISRITNLLHDVIKENFTKGYFFI